MLEAVHVVDQHRPLRLRRDQEREPLGEVAGQLTRLDRELSAILGGLVSGKPEITPPRP
jgi:hypothetical protein